MQKTVNKEEKLLNIVKYAIHIIFIVCIYLTIRWSDWPTVNNIFFEYLFVHKGEVDSAALNTVTGYITGYVVYIFTVSIPDLKRKKPIRKLAMEKIAIIYNKSVYLLLLMCKNCCQNEIEWNKVIRKNDIECFNDDFFSIMKKFDITAKADTIYLHKENRTPLNWSEYLCGKYEEIYDDLDKIFLQYQYYLDNEDIEIINKLRYSKYLDAFSGKGTQLMNMAIDVDGYGYYDNLPIQAFYSQTNNKLSPIFADNGKVKNSKMLVEYIIELKEVYLYLTRFKEKYGLDSFHEDFASSKLINNNIGHLGSSIFDLKSVTKE